MVPKKRVLRLRRTVLRLSDLDHSKAAVLNAMSSPASRRTYTYAIEQFIAWYCSEPRLALNRIVVVRYRIHLEASGLAASTINQRLAAVRRLAHEAADCGLLSADLAAGIQRVKGARQLGHRSGNWLSLEQSSQLVNCAYGDGLHARNQLKVVGSGPVEKTVSSSPSRKSPHHRSRGEVQSSFAFCSDRDRKGFDFSDRAEPNHRVKPRRSLNRQSHSAHKSLDGYIAGIYKLPLGHCSLG